MNIFLGQINPIVGDLEGNAKKILAAFQEAKSRGSDLIVFPELALTGYPPEDLLMYPHFIDETAYCLERMVKEMHGCAAIVGFPRKNDVGGEKPLFNSAALIQEGKIVGYCDKILLPTYDVFDERRYFEPGKEVCLWTLGEGKIAVTICEDIWGTSVEGKYASYKEDPLVRLIEHSPDVIVNLSSSPYSFDKPAIRLAVAKKAAKTVKAPLYLCNQVGGNDSLIFDGNSLIVDGKGELLAKGKSFEEDLVSCNGNQKENTDPIADLYQALVLGVSDYFRKLGFKKALLGVSGGIDSALVAAIAVDALGAENVHALFMPSEFTTKASHADALALIKNLGISYDIIPIDQPYGDYLDLLAPYFKKLPFNETEENLQARIRGMLLMAFSNKFGSIVLSTGNKSEMAMGYSTLYGDMCGGLGVISDLTKRQVYELCRCINREKEIIPANVLTKAPSAELRHGQIDQDSLPPYDVVDAVLEDYIIDHLSADQIAAKQGFPLKVVQDLIRRIHQSEYKRRQSAPGLRVSERAFSIGRRFPIVIKLFSN